MVVDIIGIFVLGLVLGSFFNVVGLRVPKGIPFSSDRSFCPSCKQQLHWYELIPVVSFMLQAGKCKSCNKRISWIYPFVELMTGVLFVHSYIQIGHQIELITVLLFVSMGMIIFVSDMNYLLIPNKILLFFLPFLIGMRLIVPLDPWWSAYAGSIGAFLFIAVMIIISRGGMGAGDMKLFGVLGIVLGIGGTLLTFLLASFIGAIVGIVLLSLKIIQRRQPIPFGPYIIFAAFISYFYGELMIKWYINFFIN